MCRQEEHGKLLIKNVIATCDKECNNQITSALWHFQEIYIVIKQLMIK